MRLSEDGTAPSLGNPPRFSASFQGWSLHDLGASVAHFAARVRAGSCTLGENLVMDYIIHFAGLHILVGKPVGHGRALCAGRGWPEALAPATFAAHVHVCHGADMLVWTSEMPISSANLRLQEET